MARSRYFGIKPIAVIGGGDSALEEAIYLTRFASRVYVIHWRNQLRASYALQEQALRYPQIEFLWDTIVKEFIGDELLQGLLVENVKDKTVRTLLVAGAFEAIGRIPNTAFFRGHLDCNENGYICTSCGRSFTSVNGIFAAGEVADTIYRQAITAAGEGCMAALDAYWWLQREHLI